MNDSLLQARAAWIAGFPAGLPWPATLTLTQLAALLADGCTGEHAGLFRNYCTTLRLAAEAGDLSTATTQREVKQVMRVGFIGRAPQTFSPPPTARFADVLTVTPEAAAAWLQNQPKTATVDAWLASAPVRQHRLETDEYAGDTTGPAWVAVLLDYWPQIAEKYVGRNPTSHEVLVWLRGHPAPQPQPALATNSRTFIYRDRYGKNKTVTLKTLENRLSALRRAGKLPICTESLPKSTPESIPTPE